MRWFLSLLNRRIRLLRHVLPVILGHLRQGSTLDLHLQRTSLNIPWLFSSNIRPMAISSLRLLNSPHRSNNNSIHNNNIHHNSIHSSTRSSHNQDKDQPITLLLGACQLQAQLRFSQCRGQRTVE